VSPVLAFLSNPPSDTVYIALSSALFVIGAIGFLVRSNTLVMFMCVELMLNASNLALITFGRSLDDINGQVFVFFVMVVATAEVMVGLAILVAIYRRRVSASADELSKLNG
jgi:NADH-quinone oxidoreductase subunit K